MECDTRRIEFIRITKCHLSSGLIDFCISPIQTCTDLSHWSICSSLYCLYFTAPCPKFSADYEVTYSIESNEAEVPHLTQANITTCPEGYSLTSHRQMRCSFGVWEGEEVCKPGMLNQFF